MKDDIKAKGKVPGATCLGCAKNRWKSQ